MRCFTNFYQKPFVNWYKGAIKKSFVVTWAKKELCLTDGKLLS